MDRLIESVFPSDMKNDFRGAAIDGIYLLSAGFVILSVLLYILGATVHRGLFTSAYILDGFAIAFYVTGRVCARQKS